MRDAYFLPKPQEAVELRAFTHGLMPKTVPAMMKRFVEDWQRYGVDAWNEVPNHWRPHSGDRVGWWTLPDYLGDTFIAPLIGAAPGTCIMQPNVNWTMQCLLSAPEVFSSKKEVITTAVEFPSVLHSIQHWADLVDCKPRIIPAGPDGFVDELQILSAINRDTALVVLSHVGFTSGEKLSDRFMVLVAEKVHHFGGIVALDGYHSTGSTVVDVETLRCDLYFGGLLKEASGSSGNAYVFVRPGIALSPRVTGWFGDADPFAFHPTPEKHPEVRKRFLSGTIAVASLYHAVEGIRILLDAGLENVRRDSLEKTSYCTRRAESAGIRLRSPRDQRRRGAMVILEMEKADLMARYLKTKHIYTDSRMGRYLRIAPFVWNTMGELERTYDLISEALASGSYLSTPASQIHSGPVS